MDETSTAWNGTSSLCHYLRSGRSIPENEATAGRIGFIRTLRQSSTLTTKAAGFMREVLMVYLCGVILLLAVSTTIDGEDGVGLDHILIAGFGWPILTPILALRAWTSR